MQDVILRFVPLISVLPIFMLAGLVLTVRLYIHAMLVLLDGSGRFVPEDWSEEPACRSGPD